MGEALNQLSTWIDWNERERCNCFSLTHWLIYCIKKPISELKVTRSLLFPNNIKDCPARGVVYRSWLETLCVANPIAAIYPLAGKSVARIMEKQRMWLALRRFLLDLIVNSGLRHWLKHVSLNGSYKSTVSDISGLVIWVTWQRTIASWYLMPGCGLLRLLITSNASIKPCLNELNRSILSVRLKFGSYFSFNYSACSRPAIMHPLPSQKNTW